MSRRRATATGSARVQLSASVEIAGWLRRNDLRPRSVRALAGDVSTRSYYRVRLAGEPSTWIVARYPAELGEAQRRFALAATMLTGAGVRVPGLRIDDPASGLALVEDLGPATLYERAVSWRDAERELGSALRAAAAIARLEPPAVRALGCPPLDSALLRSELETTRSLLLVPAGIEDAALTKALDSICERLGSGRQIACHRDFMARNLMPLAEGGEVAVLDFQDLRLGPAQYDLASLLNDSLFAEEELEARALASAGAEREIDDYRAAVVQRSLKAVGTYLAFARRGKPRHLSLVAPTLERALRCFPLLPETASLPRDLLEALRAAGRSAAVC